MKYIDLLTDKAKYKEKLFRRWQEIRSRCNEPSNPNYKYYGGREPNPIKVCNEWDSGKYGFLAFYAWAMQNGFKPKLTIERKNVDGNYEPSNCEWIPFADQVHNRHCSIRIWDNNKYISMKTYCDIHLDTNLYTSCLHWVHKGIPPYIALYYNFNEPVTKSWTYRHEKELLDIVLSIVSAHPNLIDNTTISIKEWAIDYLNKTYYDKIDVDINDKSDVITVWDNSEYTDLKTYCEKHIDTVKYQTCVTRIKSGIPLYIALYYKNDMKSSHGKWIDCNIHKLFDILLNIVNKHSNIVDDKTISIEEWVDNYLMTNCSDYTPMAKYIKSIKVWDTSKFVPIKTYCEKHIKNKSYTSILNRLAVGIPPAIALYYRKKLSKEDYMSLDVEATLLKILKDHPNLITPNKLLLTDYVKQYLSCLDICNYKLWGDRLL